METSRHATACVEKVGREFSRKSSIFDDDADFIERWFLDTPRLTGWIVYELKNLKLQFEDWKDGYKKKLAYLNRCLSKNANPEVEKLSEKLEEKGTIKDTGFRRSRKLIVLLLFSHERGLKICQS